MKTIAYLKISIDRQDVRMQRQVILEYAQREEITVSRFIEMPSSASKEKRS